VFLGDEAGGVAGFEGFRQALASETDLAAETARLLAEGKVVGVVQGRMEYGPRALLHRSILYHPFDPAVMEWLNARLDRTEFMPFAPVMPEEKGEEWFELAAKGTLPSRFMTVCLPARERAKQKAPAIVHVDGTARPQLVRPSTDPFVCRVLAAFERLTGVPILINTSFNRHEHPILRTAEQGVEELRRGVVDVLVLEDRMLWRAPA
jgi:carbamoyltransferase